MKFCTGMFRVPTDDYLEIARVADAAGWQTLLPEMKLQMDQQHYFDADLEQIGAVSHVRVSIYPDGGLSRVRVYGQVTEDG